MLENYQERESDLSKWKVAENDEISTSFDNKGYTIEHRKGQGYWFIWYPSYLHKIYYSGIKATIQKIMGVDDSYFGIIWSNQNINYYRKNFIISSNGYYQISKTLHDEWTNFTGWKKSSSINALNSVNELKIQWSKEKTGFFINDSLVDEFSFSVDLGHEPNVGIIVGPTMKVLLSSLSFFTFRNSSDRKTLRTYHLSNGTTTNDPAEWIEYFQTGGYFDDADYFITNPDE